MYKKFTSFFGKKNSLTSFSKIPAFHPRAFQRGYVLDQVQQASLHKTMVARISMENSPIGDNLIHQANIQDLWKYGHCFFSYRVRAHKNLKALACTFFQKFEALMSPL